MNSWLLFHCYSAAGIITTSYKYDYFALFSNKNNSYRFMIVAKTSKTTLLFL